MRVFVTGAAGFVGSAVVKELIAAGHKVVGLSRSEKNDQVLKAAGAEIYHGDLEDPDSLRTAVTDADGVIHLGFVHDFLRFKEVCELDRRVITTIGEELTGTDKPFVITSGIGVLPNAGKIITEDDRADESSPNPRIATELAADAVAAQGVKVSIVRLPPSTHGKGDHGFVYMLADIAREKGVSAYVNEGTNRWPATHRTDAAKVYRLALETPAAPGTRYHAVAEEGVAFKDIANGIGKGLNIPAESKTAQEASAYFTWFAHFAAMDCAASAQKTKNALGWEPTEPGLLQDMTDNYFND